MTVDEEIERVSGSLVTYEGDESWDDHDAIENREDVCSALLDESGEATDEWEGVACDSASEVRLE